MVSAGTAYIDVVPQMDRFGHDLDRGVSSLGSKLAKAGAVAAVGFTALAAGATAAFHAFEESEQVAAQTDAVIKSTGQAANVTAKEVNNLANALSAKTAVDDEVIQSGENMLLTFKNIRNEAGQGNDIFNQATKTLLDLSVAMGTEPKQAAIQLGKALNDPIKGITALTRVGVTFTEQQKAQITALVESGKTMEAQKIILHELNSEFGGSAEAQKTASATMSVALGNLAETIGSLVAPAFTFLAEKLSGVAAFLQDTLPGAVESVKSAFGGVMDVLQPVASFLAEKFTAIWDQLVKTFMEDLLPALEAVWNAIKPGVLLIGKLIGVSVMLTLEVLPPLIAILGKVIEVFAGIIGVISDVIGAVVRFGARVIDIVTPVWNFLKKVAEWIADKFVAGWQLLGDVAAGIWAGVVAAAQTAWNIARGILNVIISGINRVHDALAFANPFGGAGWERIDPLGAGGIVKKPTVALIGERGPEAVVPLGSGMMGLTVNVYGDVLSEGQLIDKIHAGLLQKQSRNGSLGI